MSKLFSVTMITIFLLSGCAASKPEVDDFSIKVEDKFQTAIKGDGIKLFTYKVKFAELPTLEQPHMARVKQIEKLKRSGSKKRSIYAVDLSEWTEQIELGLDKTISMTGYCRDGYIELSRIIEVGRGEIRGECNDGATEDDLKKFASFTKG
ncbi:hypothetical protein [Shewanella colwelliana]|uniref:hypothetical protein n=1 Tax=Shewanella colwelliana TaxID=23 RepID=UPI003734FCA9